MTDRILSPREIVILLGISEVTIWRMRKRGEFPEPLRVSPRRVGWRESDIRAWLTSRAETAA